jgi:hypothetical protein
VTLTNFELDSGRLYSDLRASLLLHHCDNGPLLYAAVPLGSDHSESGKDLGGRGRLRYKGEERCCNERPIVAQLGDKDVN